MLRQSTASTTTIIYSRTETPGCFQGRQVHLEVSSGTSLRKTQMIAGRFPGNFGFAINQPLLSQYGANLGLGYTQSAVASSGLCVPRPEVLIKLILEQILHTDCHICQHESFIILFRDEGSHLAIRCVDLNSQPVTTPRRGGAGERI